MTRFLREHIQVWMTLAAAVIYFPLRAAWMSGSIGVPVHDPVLAVWSFCMGWTAEGLRMKIIWYTVTGMWALIFLAGLY